MEREEADWPAGELDPDQLIARMHQDERFLTAVKVALDQADRGEFIEEGEMDARVELMLRR